MSRSIKSVFTIAITAGALTACSTVFAPRGPLSPVSSSRIVYLIAADGTGRGSVTLQEGPGGSTLTIQGTALPPGEHGLHLHEKGLCAGPAFASAGGHWNPTARKHGRDNPAGAHLGDLPNLVIDATRSGTASFTLPPGSADIDGTALVVHAKADDYRTDPSGNSGDRIACAVLTPPR
jgi:Cu-Zn family superoxide dismutase